MKTLLSLLITMSVLVGCQGSRSATPALSNMSSYSLHDISYGKDTAQRMDVYLPAGRNMSTTKVLVLIHGGGWNGGSKSDFASYIEAFRKRIPDYAIFNINYRLVNEKQLFPAQENDVKAALDFVASKAMEYGINRNKVVLLGASAGAHLALLQAYKYPQPQVKAVIDFFGPTDLVSMYNKPWHPLVPIALQMITGAKLSENPKIYEQSSPTHFVSAQSPPTLILHGGKDNIVAPWQSKELKNALDSAGVANELIIYPNEHHGWYGTTLSKSFNEIKTFLDKEVR